MTDESSNNPGCLGAILRMFGIGPEAPVVEAGFPYRRRDDFLSPAERSFYTALKAATGTRLTICPKVNLADIFFVVKPNENKGARGRISQKHLDFLLCEPATMQPVVGIELDDSSHARPDRQARDELVDGVFRAAGLPLLHIPVSSGYSVAELAVLIERQMQAEPASMPTAPVAAPVPTSASAAPPLCPKCGVSMILRTSKRGDAAGSEFYGCANYPKCRETVRLD